MIYQDNTGFCLGKYVLNSSPHGENDCDFADDIFICIFVNEKLSIFIKISLRFVHRGHIDDIPALVLIMAWRRLGDRPFS